MAGISDSKKKKEFSALRGQAQNMTFYWTAPTVSDKSGWALLTKKERSWAGE